MTIPGEVYKAKDTRLDRTVAIKVLPEHFAESPERKARFEREAKAISQLNHPHICTLYDVGEQDGIDYLVMEYIEGETLAERLKKGALPLDKALEYGIQIADGLDNAHRAGIVHRDLKPGNAMLTKLGIKLLDFGLAKVLKEEIGPESSEAPTRQKDLTKEQAIIGTLQYMAPEQLDSQPADARTDIFAFGLVLYEMVTGRKAFEGQRQASLIGAILKDDPVSMSEFQSMTPPGLEHVAKKCLAKAPEDRWQSAHDLMDELKWVVEVGSTASAEIPERVQKRHRERLLVGGLVGAVLATLVIGAAFWSLDPSAPKSVTRFALTVDELLPRGAGPLLALSPDGKTLVYAGVRDSVRQVYVRPMDQLEAVPIRRTEAAGGPFFSPDGKWIGFLPEDGALKKVALTGGPPVTVCACDTGRGATWGPNDIIVFSTAPGPLAMVPATGGDPTAVTTLLEGERIHRQADVLPAGNAVLFTVLSESLETARIDVQSLETGERTTLVNGTHPRYVATGHIVFARESSLWGVPFDTARLELTGEAVPVVEGVRVEPVGAAQFAVADNGTLVYVPAEGLGSAAEGTLELADREGNMESLLPEARVYSQPRFSPDGRQILLRITESGNRDIWLYDLARRAMSRQTFDIRELFRDRDNPAVWTPDGTRFAFAAFGGKFRDIHWKQVGGGVESDALLETETNEFPRSWSPDGDVLAFQRRNGDTGSDIWTLSLEGHEVSPFLVTRANEVRPEFSPDGAWIAYESDVSGDFEIYLISYPSADRHHQVSVRGGGRPRWAHSGDELFYVARDGTLMVVPVDSSTAVNLGRPRPLFELDSLDYDVHPDGDRFLVVNREGDAGGRTSVGQMNVVLNWFEELKRLVPTDN